MANLPKLPIATRPIEVTPERAENKGLAWLIGGFLICPCHLPLTLALASTLLSGTAAGALLRGHPYVAGALVTLAWLAATWRGIRYIQSAHKYACATTPRFRERDGRR